MQRAPLQGSWGVRDPGRSSKAGNFQERGLCPGHCHPEGLESRGPGQDRRTEVCLGLGPLGHSTLCVSRTDLTALPSHCHHPEATLASLCPEPRSWSAQPGRGSPGCSVWPCCPPRLGVSADRALLLGDKATALHAGPPGRHNIMPGEGGLRKTPETSVCGFEEPLSFRGYAEPGDRHRSQRPEHRDRQRGQDRETEALVGASPGGRGGRAAPDMLAGCRAGADCLCWGHGGCGGALSGWVLENTKG